MKNLITKTVSTMLVLGVFAAVGGVALSSASPAVLENAHVRLEIPSQYLANPDRFPWIHETEGLDTGYQEALLHLPPGLITDSDKDFILLLTLENPVGEVDQAGREELQAIYTRSGRWRNAIFKEDEATGMYRVYMNERIDNRWHFVPRPSTSEVADENTFYAVCSERELIPEPQCSYTWVRDGIGYDVTLNLSQMPHREKIQHRIEKLVESWKKEPGT